MLEPVFVCTGTYR